MFELMSKIGVMFPYRKFKVKSMSLPINKTPTVLHDIMLQDIVVWRNAYITKQCVYHTFILLVVTWFAIMHFLLMINILKSSMTISLVYINVLQMFENLKRLWWLIPSIKFYMTSFEMCPITTEPVVDGESRKNYDQNWLTLLLNGKF